MKAREHSVICKETQGETRRDAALLKHSADVLDVAKGTGGRVGDSVTYLDRAACAPQSELHNAECFVGRIINVDCEADLIDIEMQRSVHIAHRHCDHFD